MRTRVIGVGLLLALSTAACGSSPSTGASASSSSAVSANASPTSPLDHWRKAYAFLASQTKPTEIVCVWFKNSGSGAPAPAAHVPAFYDFSDTASWQGHVLTRANKLPIGTVEMCEATVPTSVRYGPGIETFLAGHGLVFGTTSPGLTSIEIAYAGQSASDPDIIYRDKPGLFGLRLALASLGTRPFVAGTSKITQPADAATAAQYLQYAQPLLTWYGYTG